MPAGRAFSLMNLRFAAFVAALAAALSVSTTATGAGFADVLDTPATRSPLAARSLLLAVAPAGDRLVAVGQRGHIVVSTDGGATWSQATVPVSVDLTAVTFVDARLGFAVGHDGVILRSDDGGERWRLMLDGRRLNDKLVEAMERRVADQPRSAKMTALLAEAKRYREQGPDKPFLDVWFADANEGWAVGAYNLIVRTVDGGRTWEPWFDRTDNPKLQNLHAIRPVGGSLYVAGEAGLVLKLDPATRQFRGLAVPYSGGFFGIADAGGAVLAFGLRGNAWRSDDGGASWTKVDSGLAASIVASARTSAGATLLADAGGRIVRSDDGGRTFVALKATPSMPLAGTTALRDDRLVVVGPRGVANATLAAR